MRRYVRALPPRTRAQHRRLLESGSLSPPERELLARAATRISHDDGMYKGDGAHYFGVGLDALRRIEEGLEAAGIEHVRRVLDMPSGYGRVLRFLVLRFPDAEVTACELQEGAVRFCAETFGAKPAQSSYDLDSLALGEEFDLIWCGSLVTHIDGARTLGLLKCFLRHLAPGGLLLFTTHGEFVAGRVGEMQDFYGLRGTNIPGLVESYRQTGHGYLDYPEETGYGVSLTSPEWVRAQATQAGGLAEVYFKERGWDEHQDVYGFVRKDD